MSSNTIIKLPAHANLDRLTQTFEKIMHRPYIYEAFRQVSDGRFHRSESVEVFPDFSQPCGPDNDWHISFLNEQETAFGLALTTKFFKPLRELREQSDQDKTCSETPELSKEEQEKQERKDHIQALRGKIVRDHGTFVFQDPLGQCWDWFAHLTDEEDHPGIILRPGSHVMAVAVGKKLIEMFGGSMIYNDSNDIKMTILNKDALFPKKLKKQSSNDRWYQFYQALHDIPILRVDDFAWVERHVHSVGSNEKCETLIQALPELQAQWEANYLQRLNHRLSSDSNDENVTQTRQKKKTSRL